LDWRICRAARLPPDCLTRAAAWPPGVVEAAFDGGDIVSDGGVLQLKRVDERLGLTPLRR